MQDDGVIVVHGWLGRNMGRLTVAHGCATFLIPSAAVALFIVALLVIEFVAGQDAAETYGPWAFIGIGLTVCVAGALLEDRLLPPGKTQIEVRVNESKACWSILKRRRAFSLDPATVQSVRATRSFWSRWPTLVIRRTGVWKPFYINPMRFPLECDYDTARQLVAAINRVRQVQAAKSGR